MRDKIITPIPHLSFSIAKETTKSGLRLKFVTLVRLKKKETFKTIRAQVMIVRRQLEKALIWYLIIDDRLGMQLIV